MAFAVVSPAFLHAELELHLQSRPVGKGDVSVNYIRDGGHDVLLSVPPGWMDAGVPENCLLLNSVALSARMRISIEGSMTSLPTTPVALEALAARAKMMVPKEGIEVTALPVFPLPTIRSFKGYGYTFNYSLFGQVLSKTILYVDIGQGRVLLVQADAPAGTTNQVQADTLTLLGSWVVPDLDYPASVLRAIREGTLGGT